MSDVMSFYASTQEEGKKTDCVMYGDEQDPGPHTFQFEKRAKNTKVAAVRRLSCCGLVTIGCQYVVWRG